MQIAVCYVSKTLLIFDTDSWAARVPVDTLGEAVLQTKAIALTAFHSQSY